MLMEEMYYIALKGSNKALSISNYSDYVYLILTEADSRYQIDDTNNENLGKMILIVENMIGNVITRRLAVLCKKLTLL